MKLPKWVIKAGGSLKQASPDICVYAGIGLMFGGFVWGCVNAAKYTNDILDEHNSDVEYIKEADLNDEYTEKDQKNDMCKAHAHMLLQFAKRGAGPLACEAVGGTLISIGFGKMKKRYVVAATALETTIAAFDGAMDRVRQKWGEEGERWARYGHEAIEVKDPETGEKIKTYKGSETDDILTKSRYAMLVDRGLVYETSNGNALYIRAQLQDYEDFLNVQYHSGVPVYYYDILRYVYGNEIVSRLEDSGLISKDLRNLGWYERDPENKDNTDDRKAINFRINTFYGKAGDDDPYDNDKVWVMIDPNIPGLIDLNVPKQPKRVGGKYLSQV